MVLVIIEHRMQTVKKALLLLLAYMHSEMGNSHYVVVVKVKKLLFQTHEHMKKRTPVSNFS